MDNRILALDEEFRRLARIVGSVARNDGKTASPVEGVSFYRHTSRFDSQPCVQPFGMVLAVQGSKEITFSGASVRCGVGDVFFVGADLSGFTSVADCSPQEPFLGINVEFDLEMLLRAAQEGGICAASAPQGQIYRIFRADAPFLDCIRRLLMSADEAALSRPLANLIRQEAALRLLHADPALAGLLKDNTALGKIVRVMAWMKRHFAENISMEDLAGRAHMSPSSFRSRFRETAGVSPLQYQKQLRLQQARFLIANEQLPASQAAAQVGYESVSQFSREYKRYFGNTALADKAAWHGRK